MDIHLWLCCKYECVFVAPCSTLNTSYVSVYEQVVKLLLHVQTHCVSLLLAGERLFWDLHSETHPLYDGAEHGVHCSTCLQSQRTSDLWSRYQIPASTTVCDLIVFLSFFLGNASLPCTVSLFRWVIQLQLNSVSTLRCSCCPNGVCGSRMAPWVSVRRVT